MTQLPSRGTLEAGIRALLEAAGRVDSAHGLAALDAARTLDEGAVSGSARAALLTVMTRSAEAATKGAVPAGGLLDELRRRRERLSG